MLSYHERIVECWHATLFCILQRALLALLVIKHAYLNQINEKFSFATDALIPLLTACLITITIR